MAGALRSHLVRMPAGFVVASPLNGANVQADIQRCDLLPHTATSNKSRHEEPSFCRTLSLRHLVPHAGPRRPCVEVEAGGRQRRGQLRAELCPLFGCGAAATPAAGRRKPSLPEREPAPATGGEHRAGHWVRLRGRTAVLKLLWAPATRPAKRANSLQLPGHASNRRTLRPPTPASTTSSLDSALELVGDRQHLAEV